MFHPNDTIGQYLLITLLGTGGMGEVWLAKDTDTRQKIALKIPTDPDYVKQLRREGKLQKALDHRNIVKVHRYDIDHEPPYVAMEFIEGRNLRDLLKAHGTLPTEQSVRIIEQVLDGLHEAHRHGVIHRDLKPENLLIDKGGTLKITDFGLGKVIEGLSKSLLAVGSMLSSAGHSIAGTYNYMSPEQREGKDIGPAADVYAAGLIFFEMLTGTLPSGSVARILKRRNIPDPIVSVIVKATDRLNIRFQSVEEMRAALHTALNHEEEEPLDVKQVEDLDLSEGEQPETKETQRSKPAKEPETRVPPAPGLGIIKEESGTEGLPDTEEDAEYSTEMSSLLLSDADESPSMLRPKSKPRNLKKPILIGVSALAIVILAVIIQSALGPRITSPKQQGTVATATPTPALSTTPGGSSVSSEPQIVSFSVETEPANATFFLDGEEMGVTPLLLQLPEGKPRIVEISAEGYHSWTARLNPIVVDEKPIPVSVKLVRKP